MNKLLCVLYVKIQFKMSVRRSGDFINNYRPERIKVLTLYKEL